MADETPKENEPQQDPSSKLDSLKRKVKDLNANPRVGGLKRFLKHHVREAFGGVLLLCGIVMDLVSWVGGIFVAGGIVLGFYPEMRNILHHLQHYYAKNGPAKNALVCGLALFLLMNAFSFMAAFLLMSVGVMLLSKKENSEL